MWHGWVQGVEKEVKTLLLKKQHLEGKSESPGSKHTSHATDGGLEKKKELARLLLNPPQYSFGMRGVNVEDSKNCGKSGEDIRPGRKG